MACKKLKDSAHNVAIVRKVQEEFHKIPPLEVKDYTATMICTNTHVIFDGKGIAFSMPNQVNC